MSAFLDEFHNLVTKLENEVHPLAAKFRSLFHHAQTVAANDAAALTTEVKADATQVAHDASAAMGPVLAEAEKDATKATVTIGADAADFAEKLAKAQAIQPPPASS